MRESGNMPASMRSWLFILILCNSVFAQTEFQNYSAPAWMQQSAVRIKTERCEGNYIVTGHGTAFGIDLAQYGYNEPRYLLSACHNVRDTEGRIYSDIKIEVRDGKSAHWYPCKVVAFDLKLDICLVESAVELPSLASLASEIPPVGSPVTLIGSPRGIPIAPYHGYLMDHGMCEHDLWQANLPFDHGDSGGPFFSSESEQVIGVAVAGIPKKGGPKGAVNPNIGLFTAFPDVQHFLASRLPSRRNVATQAPPRPSVKIVSAEPPPHAAPKVAATPAPPRVRHKPVAQQPISPLERGGDLSDDRLAYAAPVHAHAPDRAVTETAYSGGAFFP